MIVDAATLHGLQGGDDHFRQVGIAPAAVLVQQETPLDGCGEFLGLVEPRVDRVVAFLALGHGGGKPVVVQGQA